MKLGFIGTGNMASAIINGILTKTKINKKDIIGSAVTKKSRQRAKDTLGIAVTDNNLAVVKEANLIFLAVQPQFYEEVIKEIKEEIRPEQIIVTIAAGKSIQWVEEKFERKLKVVRTMPNTPVLVGEGMTVVTMNEQITKVEEAAILELLQSFGKVELIPEHLMDAVVPVSGSSPAYVFMLIEAMADSAVYSGVPREQAYRLAAQAVLGSAKMVLETNRHPGELKDMVCSPKGATIAAVRELEERGFRSAVIEAMQVCEEKCKNL